MSGANAITVSDSPNTTDILTTTLTVSHGTITVGTAGGTTVGDNGSASVTLTGTAAAINAALATTSYTGTLNYTGGDSLAVITTDSSTGASSGTQTAAITIANTTTVTRDGAGDAERQRERRDRAERCHVPVSDSPNTTDILTTTLTVSHGTITVGTAGGTTVGDNGSASVTLTGTAAAINAALATTNYTGNAELYWRRQPGGDHHRQQHRRQLGHGNRGDHHRQYHDGERDGAGDAERQRERRDRVERCNAITVSDSPNTTDILTTTLTVSHGTITVGTAGGTTVGDNGSASVTLTGTAAAINAALATTNYTGTLNYTGGDSLAVTTTDSSTGASSGTQTAAITIANTTTVTRRCRRR